MENNRFVNFLKSVHLDPDYLLSRKVEDSLKEISKLADAYILALGKTHCIVCGREKDNKKFKRCNACLTSKA